VVLRDPGQLIARIQPVEDDLKCTLQGDQLLVVKGASGLPRHEVHWNLHDEVTGIDVVGKVEHAHRGLA
jgi:hypothetical protein